jgi:carbamoyl-phosphate synthase large subunit
MRSTGEVMGIADTFARAFGKAMLASGIELGCPSPRQAPQRLHQREGRGQAGGDAHRSAPAGARLRHLCDERNRGGAPRARAPGEVVNKVNEGSPHVVDAIRGGTIAIVVNTTHRRQGGARQLLAAPADAAREHPVLHDHRGGPRRVRRPRAGAPSTMRRRQPFGPPSSTR